MKNKKLLILIKNLDGGTGTFLTQLVKIHNATVISVYCLEKRKYLTQNIDSNIHFFSNKSRSKYDLSITVIFELFKEFLWLRSALINEKPQVVISIDTHCNLIALVCKAFYPNGKFIVTTHNNVSAVFNRKLPFLLRKMVQTLGCIVFQFADTRVCNSKGVGNNFRKFFSIKKNIKVIPYGLDFKNIDELSKGAISIDPKPTFSSTKVRRVVSIGRFEEQKDFVTLIKAFAGVLEKVGQLELILIGDGSQKDMLKNLVNSLKIEKYVHFIGWKANVFPYLKKCDIFVLSSHYEGFGYVLLEALSQGLPVISTDSPYGPSEVLGNGKYGLLVPVGDINAMKKAIFKLINSHSEAKKYSEKSYERMKYYTEERMLSSYKKIINSTIA